MPNCLKKAEGVLATSSAKHGPRHTVQQEGDSVAEALAMASHPDRFLRQESHQRQILNALGKKQRGRRLPGGLPCKKSKRKNFEFGIVWIGKERSPNFNRKIIFGFARLLFYKKLIF
jgi:hypothetical protein